MSKDTRIVQTSLDVVLAMWQNIHVVNRKSGFILVTNKFLGVNDYDESAPEC